MNILAVDVGFGQTKAIGGKTEKVVQFPSLVGNFKPLDFISGQEELPWVEKLVIRYGDQSYFIGDVARRQDVPYSSLNSNRFTQNEGMALLMGAMALLLDAGENDVGLVVGLPVSDFERLKKEYRQALINTTHNFKTLSLTGKAGRNYSVNIEAVKILPQPYGSWVQCFAEDRSLRDKVVAVCDIGYFTVDLAHIEKREYVARKSSSYNEVGVHQAFMEIRSEISSSNIGVTLAEEDVTEDLISRGTIKVHGETKSFVKMRNNVLRQKARQISERIKKNWLNFVGIDEIIITGGGASLLGDMVKEELNFQDTVVCKNNGSLTNVKGYHKLATSIWG